jgi:hypothetical protein
MHQPAESIWQKLGIDRLQVLLEEPLPEHELGVLHTEFRAFKSSREQVSQATGLKRQNL